MDLQLFYKHRLGEVIISLVLQYASHRSLEYYQHGKDLRSFLASSSHVGTNSIYTIPKKQLYLATLLTILASYANLKALD